MTISIITFSPGTTAHSSEVNANFAAVVAAVNLLIGQLAGTTAGNVTLASTTNALAALITSLPTAPAADQVVNSAQVTSDTFPRVAQMIRANGAGGVCAGDGTQFTAHLWANIAAANAGWIMLEPLAVGTVNSLSTNITIGTQGWIGFRNYSTNTRLAEIKANGDFTIAGQNMKTTNSIYNYGTGGSFDSFDFAECYETDADYPTGTILCPGPQGKLSLCQHPCCQQAMIVSGEGAFVIGDTDETPGIQPIALMGRVLVTTDQVMAPGTWLTSAGNGMARPIVPTDPESVMVLGFTLHLPHEGRVGIFLRAGFHSHERTIS